MILWSDQDDDANDRNDVSTRGETMYTGFDRFRVAEAYWLVASRWHSGQASKGYAILSRLALMKFRPSPLIESDPEARSAAAELLWKRRREIKRTW